MFWNIDGAAKHLFIAPVKWFAKEKWWDQKFGPLILKKINKILATRCHILRLKCTKFDFGWALPQTPVGELNRASRNPLSGFKGPTSKEGRVRGGMGKGRERRKEKREGTSPPYLKS